MTDRFRAVIAVVALVAGLAGTAPHSHGVPQPIVPALLYPTMELQRTIFTAPFVGTTTKKPGDIEGLAYDPIRKTMWLADDSKFALYEIDYATGALNRTISQSALAGSLRFSRTGPIQPPAGLSRPADLEALAYDATRDVLYAFAGPCCSGVQHDPTVFRLVRGSDGHFAPETYQPLTAPLNDFSGVGATGGVVWAGAIDNKLYRYDYAANTFTTPTAPLEMSGHITGVGFADDGKDVWVTSSKDRLLRFTWPGLTPIDGHDIDLLDLGLRDSRSVEVVWNAVVLADGYDHYPAGTAEEFAVRIFTLGESPPVAAIGSTPVPDASGTVVGAAPLTVSLADRSSGRPTHRRWDFGDGSPVASTRQAAHTFARPGTYRVVLTASSPNGSSSVTLVVRVVSPPIASFATLPASAEGDAPLTVNFVDTSQAGDGTIESWMWDFGDGATSTDRQPTHVYTRAGTYEARLTVVDSFGGRSSATRTITVAVPVPPPPAPSPPAYVGLTPARLADTRGAATIDGRSSGGGKVGIEEALVVPIAGRGGVPPSGVDSVILNVTVTGATRDSYLTAWPTGSTRPYASNLNFVAGQTVPNLVVVPLGVGGAVSLFNDAGATHVLVDVLGYVPSADGAVFRGVTPARVADTRSSPTVDGVAQGIGRIGPGASVDVRVIGRGGVPSSMVGAVALNVTAIAPSVDSYLTVWPAGTPRPTASNLNYAADSVVPNMVIAPVGAGGAISLYNATGSTDVAVDVLGWFPTGSGFAGLSPARIADSRGGATADGRMQGGGPLGPTGVRELPILGRGGVPVSGVGSVVVNVTVTGATSDSYLSVWPTGADRPTASNLNYARGQTVANLVVVPVGTDGRISLFNASGSAQVIVDVLGWFAA